MTDLIETSNDSWEKLANDMGATLDAMSSEYCLDDRYSMAIDALNMHTERSPALTARESAGEVKVKPLVWEAETDFYSHETFKSECFFGTYWAYDTIENWAGFYFEMDEIDTLVSTGPYDTMEEAKDAAQSDFEARIRSCLA